MKNRANDENNINGLKAKTKWQTALSKKKYINEFFLPKLGRSTKNTDNKKLGASPRTVNAYEENDLLALPKINGKTTNWPK
jgi:hypothetical protein